MKYYFKNNIKHILADTLTPVSIYLKIRDLFPECILLETAFPPDNSNHYSYICCSPIASVSVEKNNITEKHPDHSVITHSIETRGQLVTKVSNYLQFFMADTYRDFSISGMHGFISYQTVGYFEDIKLSAPYSEAQKVPDMYFAFYKYILILDHFKKELFVIERYLEHEQPAGTQKIEAALGQPNISTHPFKCTSSEQADMSDSDFLDLIRKGKAHCYRGDVFQVVLSRGFSVTFQGDDFNVYRHLRSINPSPYLFYCDYGSYRIFGSSPEAQLIIEKGTATLHPIAGTFKRTGDVATDERSAQRLLEDAKENAEHVMLVDLARNDLSKNYTEVSVPVFKKIHQYSHVIHIVSEVIGMKPSAQHSALRIAADTFPAGTLSGAPKHKAIELIDTYEHTARGFYGGCIGYIGFNGDFNQAIMIRTFLSKNNILYYRAGAGVVAASVEANELEEVNNKLRALRNAIEQANTTK